MYIASKHLEKSVKCFEKWHDGSVISAKIIVQNCNTHCEMLQ